MIKKLLLFVLMFFILLNYGNTAIAKEKKATSKNETGATKETPDNSPLVQFDIATEKLPPNFRGTNIVELYTKLLKKAPLKKDEYETTLDYEKKIMAAVTDDVYAFKLDSDSGYIDVLTIHPYNADTQKLQIDIETTALSRNTYEDYRPSMIIKHIKGNSQSYIGSNAFGATVLVESYSGTQYGIALVNHKNFGKSFVDNDGYNIKSPLESRRKISLSIDMPPEKAKTLKNNIGVLLLCKLCRYKSDAKMKWNEGNDLIFEDTSYDRATIDDPTSFSFNRNFINVEVLSIWVYEINTGLIIFKNQVKNSPKLDNPKPPVKETFFDRNVTNELIKQDIEKKEQPYKFKGGMQNRDETKFEADKKLSFEGKELKFMLYDMKLKERIEHIWIYPPSAAASGISGDLVIRFTIMKNGKLGAVELVRTSSHKDLDDAAINALKDASPFWYLPESWGMDSYTVEGHFIYYIIRKI